MVYFITIELTNKIARGKCQNGIFRHYKVDEYNKMRERSKWYISSLSSICQIYRSHKTDLMAEKVPDS